MLVSATALFSGCLSFFFCRGGLGVDLLKEKPPLGGLLTEPFGEDSVDNLLCGVGRETSDQIGTLGCGLRVARLQRVGHCYTFRPSG